jgi:dipeptidyl aminopeptidase/acylaminoacyl peptidase
MKPKCLLGIGMVIACIAQAIAQSHGFNVRDAIEMNTFSEPNALDPDANAKVSPDRRYLLVVTSHGIIKSDQVESRLWLFNRGAIRASLNEGEDRPRGLDPRLLATVSAVPTASSYTPYSPVISEPRWTSDSKFIYFLRANSYGRHQICRVDLSRGVVRILTSLDYDVERYNFLNDVLVYTATRSNSVRGKVEETKLSGSVSITGTSITKILFPQDATQPQVHELWLVRHGHVRQVSDSSSHPLQRDLLHYWDVLSISPDRRFVVQINPVNTIPDSWGAYIPERGKEDWRIEHDSARATSPSNIFRARQYVLTDLHNGRSRPLINAPYGDVLAYIESFQAAWSPSSRRLLVTNTFLPLDPADQVERAKRLRPCAVTSVDIASREARCITFTRNSTEKIVDSPKALKLEDASFGATDDEVVLRLRAQRDQSLQTEWYRYSDGNWKLTNTSSEGAKEAEARESRETNPDNLLVRVKQSLNDPPTLWATNSATGKSREIWDPNPQFAKMQFGQASVYRWNDKTGFEWTGGLVMPVEYVPGRRYPLVIQTHGFADFAFMTDGLFPTAMAARPLASAGIAVLQVLGNSEHVGTLREASDNVLGYESAIEQLTSDGLIDPKRVGIIGFSRTSWYVETALVERPELVAAASINDGIDQSYMQAMLFDPGRTSEGQEIYQAKPFGEGLEKWVKLAPGFHLDQVRTPVIITAIKPGSVLQEWELYSSLYQQGKPIDFLYIPNGQHILQKPLDRLASQQGNVDWFRFWLQGYERPNPEDLTQYLRWRKLRATQERNDLKGR